MVKLPHEYTDLNNCITHPLIREALKLYGVKEFDGPDNNQVILDWAKELNQTISQWYRKDSDAWCALFMSVCAKRAGYPPPDGFDALRAKSFATWGDPVAGGAVMGDVLVFVRQGGGHVALYVGEDRTTYHCLGGNQGDSVSIARIPKERIVAIRRPPMNSCLKCQKKVWRTAKGVISVNES